MPFVNTRHWCSGTIALKCGTKPAETRLTRAARRRVRRSISRKPGRSVRRGLVERTSFIVSVNKSPDVEIERHASTPRDVRAKRSRHQARGRRHNRVPPAVLRLPPGMASEGREGLGLIGHTALVRRYLEPPDRQAAIDFLRRRVARDTFISVRHGSDQVDVQIVGPDLAQRIDQRFHAEGAGASDRAGSKNSVSVASSRAPVKNGLVAQRDVAGDTDAQAAVLTGQAEFGVPGGG